MKKLCFLLSLLLVLSLAACGESAPAQDPTEVYKQTAQQHIDAGDTATAIAVLEEGIAVTGSEELSQMLEQLKNPDTETPAEEQTAETEQAEEAQPAEPVDAVESYKQKAQKHIDAGDTEAAIEVLEEGVSLTGNKELSKMLRELKGEKEPDDTVSCPKCKSKQPKTAKFCSECGADMKDQSKPKKEEESKPEAEKTVDPDDYMGSWSTEGACYADGGFIVELSKSGKKIEISLTSIGTPPYCRNTNVTASIPTDEFTDPLIFDYDEDSWGNSGTVRMQFVDQSITVTFSDTRGSGEWSFNDGSYIVYRNSDVHEDMAEPAQANIHTKEEAFRIISESLDRQLINVDSQPDVYGRQHLPYLNDTPFTFDLAVAYEYYNGDTYLGVDSDHYYTLTPNFYVTIILQNIPQNAKSFRVSYQYGNIYENGQLIY